MSKKKKPDDRTPNQKFNDKREAAAADLGRALDQAEKGRDREGSRRRARGATGVIADEIRRIK